MSLHNLLAALMLAVLLGGIHAQPTYAENPLQQLIEGAMKNLQPSDTADPAPSDPENPPPPTSTAPSSEGTTPVTSHSTPLDNGFASSFGDHRSSLFFAPKELEKYLKVIRLFEENELSVPTFSDPNAVEDPELQDVLRSFGAEQKEEEPIVYPYHHLGSILYYGPRAWALNMNGITITKENNVPDNELFVTSLQKNRASFIWTSQDKRLMLDLKKKFKTLEKNRPEKLEHRRVKRQSGQPFLSEDGMSLHFTLEPNQLFYSEYLSLYEGAVDDIIPAPPPPPVASAIPAAQEGDALAPALVPLSPATATPPAQAGSATGTQQSSAPPASNPTAQTQAAGSSAAAQSPALPSQSTPSVPKKRNALNSFSVPESSVPAPPPPTPAPQPVAAPTPVQPATPASSSPPRNSNEVPLEELPSIDSIAP